MKTSKNIKGGDSPEYFSLNSYTPESVRSNVIRVIEASLKEDKKKILIELSLGLGKSKVVTDLIQKLITVHQYKNFLILVDRREIANQYQHILDKFESTSEACVNINIVTAQSFDYTKENITQQNKINEKYDFIFVDDCSRGFARIKHILEMLNTRVVAFTRVVSKEHTTYFETLSSFKISFDLLTGKFIESIFTSKYKDVKLLKISEIASLEYYTGDDMTEKDYDLVIYPVFSPGKIVRKADFVSLKTSKSSRYIGCKINKGHFLPEFIYLFSLQEEYKKQINLCKKGSVIESISIKQLENILIPNYPTERQNAIVRNWMEIESIKNKVDIVEKQFFDDYLEVDKYKNIIQNLNFKVDPVSAFPEPIATAYYQYKNCVDSDKKLKDLITCYEVTTRFLGISILCALKQTIEFKEVAEKERYRDALNKKPDIYTPISTGYWKNVIKYGVELLVSAKSFYSDHVEEMNRKVISICLDILAEYRDSYSHELNSLNKAKINYLIDNIENKVQELLNQFSFLSKYPLVFVEPDEIKRRGNIYRIVYLIGDTKSKRQDKKDSIEEFYTSLYLYSNFPDKSIELSPLIIYEDCPLCKDKEILFFDYFNKKEDTPIYRGCNKYSEEIKFPEYKDDILNFFNKYE